MPELRVGLTVLRFLVVGGYLVDLVFFLQM
jgi:hypothetical protein